MEVQLVRGGFRRAIAASHNPAKRRVLLQPRRFYATPTRQGGPSEEVRAAAPISFTDDPNQFAPRMDQGGRNQTDGDDGSPSSQVPMLRRIRVLPASPSYFTATPQFTDDLIYLSTLMRRHLLLPKSAPGEVPKIAWKTLEQYRTELTEPVREKGHGRLLRILRRLNQIHPSLLPLEVERAMLRYKRLVQPDLQRPKPVEVDQWGRARGVGRRKSSHAAVWLVEGEGQCLINGRSLVDYFPKLHDRDSALFALKATQRLDKYNVFVIAKGGGTTGQAEAITLGVAKALAVHEPDLKRVLRQANVLFRDRRKVERKKPGKLKARKMPAWVKR